MHGPNGFYREFAADGPAIVATPADGELFLAIKNSSHVVAQLTLTSAYDGKHSKVTVPPWATVKVPVPTAFGTGWYDVSVTSASHSKYLRRLAGHVETGKPSVSDPGFGL